MEDKTQTNNELSPELKAIDERLEHIYTISGLLDTHNELFDEKTLTRLKAGVDYLIYECNYKIKNKHSLPLKIDGFSAQDIVDVSQIKLIDNNEINVKKCIDYEMKFICKFVDYIIESTDKTIDINDLKQFIAVQMKLNTLINKGEE